MPKLLVRILGLSAALLLLASCGGNSSGSVAGSTPPATTQPTTLALSVSSLALSVNDPGLNARLTGTPRTITVTNTGTHDAEALAVSMLPVLPGDASFTSNCGLVLAGGSSCQITITPGQTPSAALLTVAPTDPMLLVTGGNTNTVTAAVRIVSYGNVHQGGYVYALDDTSPTTGSVGGKVLALSPASAGEIWGPDGALVGENFFDARAATQLIVDQFPGQASAAKTCTDSTMGGYTDWTLPTQCEVGGCGGGQAMDQNLIDSYFTTAMANTFWLATTRYQSDPININTALVVSHTPGSINLFPGAPRSGMRSAHCIRAFAG